MTRNAIHICTALLLGLVLTACAEIVSREAPPAERIDDKTLIVLSNNNIDRLVADASALGYVLTRRTDLNGLDDTLLSFRIPEGTTIPDAIVEVEELQPGATAGANHAYRLQATGPDKMTMEFADQMIGWPANSCGTRGTVGLIDAGVAPNHPAIASGQVVQRNFSLNGKMPATDHGTLMADIMMANQRLDRTKLFSANVIDPEDGDGSIAGAEAIVRAVDWMVQNDVPVVNISLTGPQNKILRRGLETATKNGLIVIAAAGNQGPAAPPLYPAAYPFTIAVTAVDSKMQVYRRALQGTQIDIAAPGVDVLVQSQNRLRIVSGTSAAAVFVTSAVATSPSLRNSANADALRAKLGARALDLGPKGRDTVFGYGLVRASSGC